ncbi:hypothetical protein LOTGIDRAFT_211712 [Lottia gigantea]|uniref:26S proteasome non-ATPase regulatory subunit 5 n=1 Tax=Lottia gigantea TaxID=225164 RepID=V4CR07_LOTGI|nr:hypothetical protein LOTGIDRAFT_211712 [Lottia gigantea]ESP04905.1 hypothetical protein LOTGIDRAFT_211712 [Lottia gigantea]
MSAGQICEILERLNISSDPLNDLEELKTVLYTIHPSTLREANASGPISNFSQLFNYLNTDKVDQQKLVCETIERLLSGLLPSQICDNFKQEIENGLNHSSPDVNCLCLTELLRIAIDDVNRIIRWPDIISKIITQLSNKSLSVAKLASDILVTIGKNSNGINSIYNNSKLTEVMSQDDTVKFRVYQIVVDLSRLSEEGLQMSVESGLLQKLTNEIFKDDILLQLNAIEMLSDLSQVEHGLQYLDQSSVLAKLEEMMRSTESDPMSGLLLPGLVKFFGGMCRVHPKEVCMKFPAFINIVFNNLDSSDISQKNVAIDTIGFLGSTVEGKLTLEKLGQQMTRGMKCLGGLIKSTKTEDQLRALDSLTNLITLRVSDQTEELLSLTESWFNQLMPEPFQYVWSLCQRPFLDIRCTAYNTLKALAILPWAQKIMNDTPGFTEFLLNRSTETSKEGRDSKYQVIKAIFESPTVSEIFGDRFYVKVAEYCNQGAFYVRAQAEVAMEEES